MKKEGGRELLYKNVLLREDVKNPVHSSSKMPLFVSFFPSAVLCEQWQQIQHFFTRILPVKGLNHGILANILPLESSSTVPFSWHFLAKNCKAVETVARWVKVADCLLNAGDCELDGSRTRGHRHQKMAF